MSIYRKSTTSGEIVKKCEIATFKYNAIKTTQTMHIFLSVYLKSCANTHIYLENVYMKYSASLLQIYLDTEHESGPCITSYFRKVKGGV